MALGRPIHEAVVTRACLLRRRAAQAARVAGELAGLRVERIINEPTAAALAYGLHARDRPRQRAGLGRRDVRRHGARDHRGVIEVQASAGDARLGGEDFADLLALDFARELSEMSRSPPMVLKARVREAAEAAEATALVHAGRQRGAGGTPHRHGTQDVGTTLPRTRAERILAALARSVTRPHRAGTAGRVALAFGRARGVVGGQRHAFPWAAVADMVAQTFGRVPNRSLPADEAVAMGAAVQAALKQEGSGRR